VNTKGRLRWFRHIKYKNDADWVERYMMMETTNEIEEEEVLSEEMLMGLCQKGCESYWLVSRGCTD